MTTHRAPWCALLLINRSCNASPGTAVFGAYFPAWLVFALLAVGLAVCARAILNRRVPPGRMPLPLLTFPAIGVVAAWLLGWVWGL